jgi:activator of 2-hydroxyglutaryl-CoA dehydratase/predicted nucleotide-binding protein (sugar kinase/HSP70/actin superfamily)
MIWQELRRDLNGTPILATAFTGSAAAPLAELFPGTLFEYESVAIPRGVGHLVPGTTYVAHMGAKDSYFFTLGAVDIQSEQSTSGPLSTSARTILLDWSTSTKCGGGSGTLLEKQVRRLFGKNLEETAISRSDREAALRACFSEAERAAARHPFEEGYNARCGVVIQSDLIHDQNEGFPRDRIVAKLLATVAANFVTDVVGYRDLDPSAGAVCTGGVFASSWILERLRALTGLAFHRPPHFANVAALGVALGALATENRVVAELDILQETHSGSEKGRRFAPPLKNFLPLVHLHEGEMPSASFPRNDSEVHVREVVIGVDGGSTTTKAALLDLETGALLDGIYLATAGDPEGALLEVFRHLEKNRHGVSVAGVCTTGSARKLYERMLLSRNQKERALAEGYVVADGAVDEITCHAAAIKFWDPDIDTVFEIGGQDMKFTTFKRTAEGATDEIREARMNYSCQAGAGQTLENLARILGMDVKDSLQEAALRAERVPLIDATCGVFMEMDVNRLIAEGLPQEEIAAGVVRGTAESYFTKFVGGRKTVGERCSCQGGPSLGKAFLAALAAVTGTEIHAYPNRELFGAVGAALVVRDALRKARSEGKETRCTFRGWEAVHSRMESAEVLCREHFGELSCGQRNCKLRIFRMEGEDILTGGFCPQGNSETSGRERPDYVEIFHSLMERHFDGIRWQDLPKLDPEDAERTVAIRRSNSTLGHLGIWSARVLHRLGFLPVLTPATNDDIAQRGIKMARTEFCIAMKISTGHALLAASEPRIAYAFNPAFIEERQERPPHLKFCVYSEAEGFILRDALGRLRNRCIDPVWHLGDRKSMAAELKRVLAKLGRIVPDVTILEAFADADTHTAAFLNDLAQIGDSFLDAVRRSGEPGYVGLGRDYVVLDPKASSSSGHMFSKVRGMRYIPQIFLQHRYRHLSVEGVAENEYWLHNLDILKASLFVAKTPGLYPIRQMNFACGPDSIKFFMEETLFSRVDKPFLHLVTDAQTNNAPFVTRAEAHERIVLRSALSDKRESFSPKAEPNLSENAVSKAGAAPSLPCRGAMPGAATTPATKRPSFSQNGITRTRQTGWGQERCWLIPNMGDGSRIAAAFLRHRGIAARSIPTDTPAARERGAALIKTETCFPLKGVVGDVMAFLDELADELGGREQVGATCLLALPTASGPCRFGKYAEVLRILLDQQGFETLPILCTSCDDAYLDILDAAGAVSFKDKALLATGLYMAARLTDAFDDVILRFRPYGTDRNRFEAYRKERLAILETLLATKGIFSRWISRWAQETLDGFSALAPRAFSVRFPLVLYAGEIYMRQHDPYTQFVIHRLEQEELEVVRSPISEWMDYVAHLSGERTSGLVRIAGKTFLNWADRWATRLFRGITKDRQVLPSPETILSRIEEADIFSRHITGESPLSIGLFFEFLEGRLRSREGGPEICGYFHVGPFTCMQEGVATAIMNDLARERRRRSPDALVPVVHAFFGDSPNPNLQAEIAAFREQVYLKSAMNRRKVS